MSGYNWRHGKSNRAVHAETEGKLPLTRAIVAVARQAGCTQAAARVALVAVGPCEWHHSSKFYNRVDYYDVAAALRYLAAQPELDKLPAGWADRVTAEVRRSKRFHDDVIRELAEQYGVPPATVEMAYYRTWDLEDEDEDE